METIDIEDSDDDLPKKKRKTKWDADKASKPTQMPVQRPEHCETEDKDALPSFTEEEMADRTVIIDPLPLDVKGKELMEFFNGAVLAVTGNTLEHANRSMAPIYSCTVTEEDKGKQGQWKVAELRFRTPEGATVCLRLDGIEYAGQAVKLRRPANFVYDLDEEEEALESVPLIKLIGLSNNCSIFNLPSVLPEPIVRGLLSQFGKLKSLKLPKDVATEKIKGYGIFEYADVADTDLAIRALNGFVCGNNVLRVQKLGGAAAQAAAPPTITRTCTDNPHSITQKIIKNPAVAFDVKQGRLVGSEASTVVQLINAISRTERLEEQDYEDILQEMYSEAAAVGKVIRVEIPRPSADGSNVSGLGKVFIAFEDLTSARKFQLDTNGRKFEERIVCAAFYPSSKFKAGEYNLPSAGPGAGQPGM
eukprot:TRINITY_DN47281_c0_g1_i1.p1 TRINITY_DN47281_c0_g1~~TRINITY_DN47281_c0_g1_i1.p1  ORF type:complete len:419 (+),score=95.32 TRINITY_DN47281_c0_g1_i1:48-1304(+)